MFVKFISLAFNQDLFIYIYLCIWCLFLRYPHRMTTAEKNFIYFCPYIPFLPAFSTFQLPFTFLSHNPSLCPPIPLMVVLLYPPCSLTPSLYSLGYGWSIILWQSSSQGKFLYIGLSYENGVLTSQRLDPNGFYKTGSWLERVIIVGLDKKPTKVTLSSTCKSFLVCCQNRGEKSLRWMQLMAS